VFTFGSATTINANFFNQLQSVLNSIGAFSVVTAKVDFNSANTDTQVAISLPPGFTRYKLEAIIISGASASISSATFGVFPAAAGAGTAIVSTGTSATVNTANENTNNNMQVATIVNVNTLSFNLASIFFRVQSAQGSPATATVTVVYRPIS
jgi:hypothetical protein